jgi:hypothetical protein
MTFVLALETPTGGLTTFTSPVPWATASNVTPTVNGRTHGGGYTLIGTNQVMFHTPPRLDDVVGFLVGP